MSCARTKWLMREEKRGTKVTLNQHVIQKGVQKLLSPIRRSLFDQQTLTRTPEYRWEGQMAIRTNFGQKSAYAGFYPNEISKIFPEAEWGVQMKIACESGSQMGIRTIFFT